MSTTKPKKISISALEKAMKETYNQTKTFEWRGIEIVVNPTLSFKQMMNFVSDATSLCFAEFDEEYLPEVKDCAIKSCIVELYTNITLPDDISRKYDLLYRTDMVDSIIKHINQTQLAEICESINKKINNKAQSNIEATNRQISELYATFDSLQQRIEGIFSGVTQDDISKLVVAMGNGSIDEEKLVKAYKESFKKDKGE